MLRSYFISLFFAVFLLSIPIQTLARDINVLVVAIDGEKAGREEWQPTIDFLQKQFMEHQFNLIPVIPTKLDQIKKLVSEGTIDFVITQPAIYVDLELSYGVSRILTLEKEQGVSEFGSVLVAKTGNGILTLEDLHGKRVAGVSELGFGGWLLGYNEMLESEFDPYKSALEVKFLGAQENVLQAIIDGDVEVGVLRTGILEKYFQKGYLKRQDIHVLNEKNYPHFGDLISTALYPEWAFARTRKVDNDLAEKVALITLSIPGGGEVARKGRYWKWTMPYDYQSVHRVMQKLRVGPYEDYGKVTIKDILIQYKSTIVVGSVLSIIILIMSQ